MRQADHIYQSESAKRVGVSRQFLNAIEHEKKSSNIDFAIKIVNALGYPEDIFVEKCINDMLKRSGIKKVVELKSNKAA